MIGSGRWPILAVAECAPRGLEAVFPRKFPLLPMHSRGTIHDTRGVPRGDVV